MQEAWNDELVLRENALKCRQCGGTNPYICRCARDAFFESYKTNNYTLTENEKMEWERYCALICTPLPAICGRCTGRRSISLCECAKSKWLEQYKRDAKKLKI